ncbi:transcriptional regulator, DeoR family [Paramicrobacterium humi]|uniref:Transcriptional regulator, DeoR family n=2 Tax=Paramicrobacterium humi TaxID=640635 RepID=A0A1H4L770_9MICO|nr:transcriptional regulator, DeoR family [Microbacterium humi]
MTVRRDLARLDSEGVLQRVHGGATAPRPRFSKRVGVMVEAKSAIARKVAELIVSGDTVGLDSGTSCRAVAAELAPRDDLLIVTNSIQAAVEFQYSRSSVIVLGGMLTSEATLVSGDLVEKRRQLQLNKLVLGCGGLTALDGISYFDVAETEVRRSLLGQSDTVIMAADHTKLGQRKGVVLDRIDVLDVLVTDKEPDRDLRNELLSAGVEIVVTG